MTDKERIKKAIEIIAGENKIDMKTPDKLYATKQQIPEIETESGLFKIGMDYEGRVEIKSSLGPKISIMPIHTNEISKAICPKGAIYEITTSNKEGEDYYTQSGVCYVDANGLVINSERNIRINREMNIKRD